jgi:DNA primase
MNYFKLRKLKKMFDDNQRDMEHASYEEQIKLIELHKQLKEFEREITKQLGTVIIR